MESASSPSKREAEWSFAGLRCKDGIVGGQDNCNRPLHSHHDHVHTIPVNLDGKGHLDHILLFAKRELGDVAQQAIRQVKRTWAKGGVGDIQVAVVGYWHEKNNHEALRRLPDELRANIESLLGAPAGARVWESVTPFVPPRFLKKHGKNSLEGQVNAELASRLLPTADEVHAVPELTRKLRHYVRRRGPGSVQPPMDVGFGLRLVFSEPVAGPLLLGYASHYGLGMFRSVSS